MPGPVLLWIYLVLSVLYAECVEVTFRGKEFFSYSLKQASIPTDKNVITLRFKTIYPSGLLFYSRGSSDYIQLELIDGALK